MSDRELTCFDLLATSHCIECREPVMTNEGNTICQECFRRMVWEARYADTFGSHDHWREAGLTDEV